MGWALPLEPAPEPRAAGPAHVSALLALHVCIFWASLCDFTLFHVILCYVPLLAFFYLAQCCVILYEFTLVLVDFTPCYVIIPYCHLILHIFLVI